MKALAFALALLCAVPAVLSAQRDPEYTFQHRVLPQFYYINPAGMRQAMSTWKAGAYLTAFRETFQERLPDSSEVAKVTNPDWRVQFFQFDSLNIFVLTPPAPKKSPLCHLIALVYPNESDTARYYVLRSGFFTLERGAESGYSPLCGWVMNSGGISHSNYGDFNSKDPKRFAQRVAAAITKRKPLEKKAGITIPEPQDTTKQRQGAPPDGGGE